MAMWLRAEPRTCEAPWRLLTRPLLGEGILWRAWVAGGKEGLWGPQRLPSWDPLGRGWDGVYIREPDRGSPNVPRAHSWEHQPPGVRATLLVALAAALERRGAGLAERLQQHGADPEAAKTEVELSAGRLRLWAAYAQAQAQGHTLQVSGLCVGQPDRIATYLEALEEPGVGSEPCAPTCGEQRASLPLHSISCLCHRQTVCRLQ